MPAATLVPLLALAAVGIVLWAAWPRRRRTVPWEGRTRSSQEAARVAAQLRDRLDRTLFGEVLARQVWAATVSGGVGQGAILHHHRDYCGHGLIRSSAGVVLCEVQDGGAFFGPPLAEWTTEQAFVAFLAAQSDFSCSGWDPAAPLFFTSDPWHRNNQRLTRAGLYAWLDACRTPPSRIPRLS